MPSSPLVYIIAGIAFLATLAGLYVKIHHDGYIEGKQEIIGKNLSEKARIVTLRGAVTEKIVTKYVHIEAKTKAASENVANEVAKYAEKNRSFTLDYNWRVLHDDAAANRLPNPTGKVDAAGGTAPTASEALSTVTQNYAACNRTADRLDGLQEWVREQAKVK